MPETKPFDLAQMLGEAVTQWERSFDQSANQVMGTEAFSQWMNQMQSHHLSMQDVFTKYMAQQLQTLELPSREDVTSLSEAVLKLEKRMGRVERSLKKITRAEPPVGKQRPTRTRRAIATEGPVLKDRATSTIKDVGNG